MKLLIFVLGLLVGAVLALSFIEQYAVYTPLETRTASVSVFNEKVIHVTNDSVMQPFGRVYEDEITGRDVVQPARGDVQVTRNYVYLQPTKTVEQFQGTSPQLQ